MFAPERLLGCLDACDQGAEFTALRGSPTSGDQRMDDQHRHRHPALLALLFGAIAAHACGTNDNGALFPAGSKCTRPENCASHVCTAGVCQDGASTGGSSSGDASSGGASSGGPSS